MPHCLSLGERLAFLAGRPHFQKMPNTKIATCCYCGTRAALVLSGTDHKELSCASCGAPLHNLKMLRSEAKRKPAKAEKKYAQPAMTPGYSKKKKKKPKKKKGLMHSLFDEVFDAVEDIFD